MTQRHHGNLTVTADNAASFPPVTEFFGHLTIAAGAHLVAPNLQLIRGWLTIHGAGAMLTAEHLGTIDGWLSVNGGHIQAPNLLTVGRDVTLNNADIAIGLLSVGSLVVRDMTVHMNALRNIDAGLTLGPSTVMFAPDLNKIGGSITLKETSQLNAPNLKHIGGFYDADETAKLVAPAFLNS